MSGGGHGGGGPSPLGWLIIVVLAIGVLWYFTGGPERANQNPKPFLKPLDPIDTGETYELNP